MTDGAAVGVFGRYDHPTAFLWRAYVLTLWKKIGTFFNNGSLQKMQKTLEQRILRTVRGHGHGWVFTPRHFAGYDDARSVGMALTRLSRKGMIRRLARGLYDYPRYHDTLGPLSPSTDAVAKALAGRDAIRLQPSGGYAANRLGLSDHVPMRVVFLTDGPARSVNLGKQQIILKHTTPRNMATAGRISGLVIQALRHIGKEHVDDGLIEKLRARLDDQEKKQLLKDMRYAPAWIAAVFRQIAQLKRESHD